MRLWQVLTEDLGTLAQLKLGPLGDLLKQHRGYHSDNGIKNKFNPNFSQLKWISNTSPVVDLGVLKTGLKDLRAAFKKSENDKLPGCAFVVYIAGQAVIFAITDVYHLAGGSREQWMAWDLTVYKDDIATINKDLPYNQKFNTIDTTIRTQTDRKYDYSNNTYDEYTVKLAGMETSTGSLADLMNMIMLLGKRKNLSITAKLVLRDTIAHAKRQKRQLSRLEIEKGTKDLQARLTAYKLSKQPTADTIHEFIDWCNRNKANIVTFAGVNYRMTPSNNYEKVTPLDILNGQTFQIAYQSDPGSEYRETVYLTYRYQKATNQMSIIAAEWTNRSEDRYRRETAIIDPVDWFRLKKNATAYPDIAAVVRQVAADPAKKSDRVVHREIMKTIVPILTVNKNYKEAVMLISAIQLLGITFTDLEHALDIAQQHLDSN